MKTQDEINSMSSFTYTDSNLLKNDITSQYDCLSISSFCHTFWELMDEHTLVKLHFRIQIIEKNIMETYHNISVAKRFKLGNLIYPVSFKQVLLLCRQCGTFLHLAIINYEPPLIENQKVCEISYELHIPKD